MLHKTTSLSQKYVYSSQLSTGLAGAHKPKRPRPSAPGETPHAQCGGEAGRRKGDLLTFWLQDLGVDALRTWPLEKKRSHLEVDAEMVIGRVRPIEHHRVRVPNHQHPNAPLGWRGSAARRGKVSGRVAFTSGLFYRGQQSLWSFFRSFVRSSVRSLVLWRFRLL